MNKQLTPDMAKNAARSAGFDWFWDASQGFYTLTHDDGRPSEYFTRHTLAKMTLADFSRIYLNG